MPPKGRAQSLTFVSARIRLYRLTTNLLPSSDDPALGEDLADSIHIMPPDDRVTARLGSTQFEFAYPVLDGSQDVKTATLDVLPTDEGTSETTAETQVLSHSPRTFTLRGDCYEDEVEQLYDLLGEETVLRHPKWSGRVLVESVDDSRGSGVDEDGRWYTFRVDLQEA
ncbi:hypothetical protein J2752_000465 [Halarchaeum rubridurum]|uniref:Uncharacterized protein n=1 Tax=Halarchaeum rubridurum TaxID=489911 RepID=A0A8T4GNR8_9EURY|nr:hypothetical protein [Halarchaeum rubridurum]MBP1953584.1 hypothetical protein [Halarchaeum rubridurum]